MVVCFAALRSDYEPGDSLREEIKKTIVGQLGKALQSKDVRLVRDLSKARNAKITRRVIRAAYLGQKEMGDVSSLENPSAVGEIAWAR